ncbi:MAG: LacI family transcriptional regulator [Planctomycetota bacterium]|jgi:LacI family transcriptional regulator|nr:LacI family transcriptional regulator [Planctomycetota bacterium]
MRDVERPTILNVAQIAGVSVGSVSNVFNGTRPVSDKLRQRVMNAAETLGYRVNSVARSLRRQQSNVIGYCTPNLRTTYLLELYEYLDEALMADGYELSITLGDDLPERERMKVQALLGRQVDGLVLLPSPKPQKSLDLLHKSGLPVVVIDRLAEDERFIYVIADNREAMHRLAGAFQAAGHSRLLFIVRSMDIVTSRHRLEGLEQCAVESDGLLRYEVAVWDPDPIRYAARLRALLAGPAAPTAIVAGNSRVALWTIRALQELGIRYPDHIALATFDDPEWAGILTPPLTAVRTPARTIATRAWSLLKERIDGAIGEPTTITVKAEIVVRASCGGIRPV